MQVFAKLNGTTNKMKELESTANTPDIADEPQGNHSIHVIKLAKLSVDQECYQSKELFTPYLLSHTKSATTRSLCNTSSTSSDDGIEYYSTI